MRWATDYFFWGATGFLWGSILIIWNLRKNDLSYPLAVLLTTLSIYAGLFGSRVLYVLTVEPRLFISNFLLAIAFWQGNLSWQGGIIAGFGVNALMLALFRKPVWPNLGAAAPGIAMAHMIARIGCLCQGCCYGAPCSLPWAIYSKRLHTMVHPTQVYSMIGELITCVILQWQFRHPNRRKYILPLYGILLSFHRFISEGFRGTPWGPQIIEGLRFYQVVCLGILLVSLSIFLLLWKRKKGLFPVIILILISVFSFFIARPHNEKQMTMQHNSEGTYLVLTRTLFEEPLNKWQQYRKQQGYSIKVKIWDKTVSSQEFCEWIDTHTSESLRYILIVGDVGSRSQQEASWYMPSLISKADRGLGSDYYQSDALYGDVDHDGIPDIPVGRLPVRTRSQLKTQINKIIQYEKQPLSSQWFRSVIWSGAKGYEKAINEIVNQLQPQLPKWLKTSWVNQSDNTNIISPGNQPERFLEELKTPALISVIISHGAYNSVTLAGEDNKSVFLSVDHLRTFESEHISGPLFILACQSGKLDLPDLQGMSIGQVFALNSAGPVGTVASTTTMQPITNYFIVREIALRLKEGSTTTGNFWLAIQKRMADYGKRTMAEAAVDDPLRQEIKKTLDKQDVWTMPGLLSHEVMSYQLLGDPACPLLLPTPITCSVIASDKGKLIFSSDNPNHNSEVVIDRINTGYIQRLKQEHISTSKFNVECTVSPDFYSSNDYLRVLTLNNGLPGYYIYNKKPFSQNK